MKKVLRWIATPLAFPIGLVLGHCFGLLNALFPISYIGLFFLWLICGACSAIGSIMFPVWVAPSHKYNVGIVAFWCQVIVFIGSIGSTIYLSEIAGKELFEYIVSMIGCAAGAIYCKVNMEEFTSTK